MDIVIIGSGNVASALGTKILEAGHDILQVVARNSVTGKRLADQLHTDLSIGFAGIRRDATLYIAALNDDSLYRLGQYLTLEKGVIVHTAGSVPMETLKTVCNNHGVLYPLQTLRAGSDPVPPFPLLVDGNTAETLTLVRDLAETISNQVVEAKDDYRLKIHLSAVVSGNFSNHIFALVRDYCDANGLDFSLLLPQVRQIVDNLSKDHPANRQTGPALRNDVITLKRHVAMLGNHTALGELYEMMTRSIQNYHSDK